MSLPTISILTPTYNRRHTFKLAIENFYAIDYPQLKLEWIIIDDGTDSIKDMLPNESRIKYFYIDDKKKKILYDKMVNKLDKNKNNKKNKNKLLTYHKKNFYLNRLPLGLKRNLCNKYANNNIRIHMDDDDYYPPLSIQNRLNGLKHKDIECVFCTTIPNFDINQFKSIINNAGDRIPMEKGLSVNTMAYTREFWKNQYFKDQDLALEGINFIKGRSRFCKVIDYRDVIVGLVHRTNFSNRIKMPNGDANGWGFDKVSDKLFLIITSFDDKFKNNK